MGEVVKPPTRAAKWYWGTCAIVGLALTILVNGAHAKAVMPDPNTWTAVVVAVIPPIMFAALFEGFFLARRTVPVSVLRVVKASVVVLGGASFAISYTTIAYFIQRRHGELPEWTAWVMPGLLDLFVAVSAYVVYVLSKHAAVEASETAKPSRWAKIGGNLMTRAEQLTEPKTSVEPSAEGLKTPTETPVSGVTEPLTDPSVEALETSTTPSVEPSAEEFVEPLKTPAKVSAKPSPRALETVEEPLSEELLAVMDEAREMEVADLVRGKSAIDYARIVAALDANWSPTRIKNEHGYSHGTTAKVAAFRAEHRELEAVS